MMEGAVIVFGWVEYAVFSATLGVSALVGVYFGFIKGGQDTVDGYLLGGKEMGVFPISMSLTAGFISGITMLGIPAEIYVFGTQYVVAALCFITSGAITMFIFLPVFHELQAVSVYEYMELRFNTKVRKFMSFLFTFHLFGYIPVVIYGPALALNQVSGLNVHLISVLVCIVCIFYTTFGGLKAVVWADTLQSFVMIGSAVLVAILGTFQVGGVSNIVSALDEGERIQFFDLDPDPLKRLSFWNVVIGVTFMWTTGSAVSPSLVQRIVALNSISKSKRTIVYYSVGCFILFFLSCYLGMVAYARYQTCDPLTTGAIKRSDQILPYFILEALGGVTGLPGLFLAGIVCAALSTMSTSMNTVAGTLYEDFVEPMFGKTSEARASLIMKLLVASFGGVCILLVMVIEKLGSLIELSAALGGVSQGSLLGVFLLGVLFPPANGTGALTGAVANLLLMSWVLVGSRSAIARGDIVYPLKPMRVDLCPFNLTSPSANVTSPMPVSGRVNPMFEISIFYFTLFGTLVTVVTGLAVSYLTGRQKSVDQRLLTPAVRRLLYRKVPLQEQEMKKNAKA